MTEPEALFPTEAVRPSAPGRVLAEFRRLVAAGRQEGTLADVDGALIEAAEVLAEALDTARRIGGMKGGYLAVQALPPFQKALHALRLPVELTAAATPPSQGPVKGSDTPDWLRDAFGTAE